jgi:hypothetical protein
MDESLLELEHELQRLTPRAPSPALLAALGRDLDAETAPAPARRYSSATNLRSWKWVSWSLAAGAAAALALVMLRNRQDGDAAPAAAVPDRVAVSSPAPESPTSPVVPDRYEPVQATSVLYDLEEGHPTTLPDRTEGRAVRYRYVDTYTWKNPATNASLRWSVPRDEVRLVRTNFN